MIFLLCFFKTQTPGELALSGGSPHAHDQAGPEQSAQHGPAVALLREEPQLRQGGPRAGPAGRHAQVGSMSEWTVGDLSQEGLQSRTHGGIMDNNKKILVML